MLWEDPFQLWLDLCSRWRGISVLENYLFDVETPLGFSVHCTLCAVVKRADGSGFLITAYHTDSIKVGDVIWTKSK
jgi:hypothetical protein